MFHGSKLRPRTASRSSILLRSFGSNDKTSSGLSNSLPTCHPLGTTSEGCLHPVKLRASWHLPSKCMEVDRTALQRQHSLTQKLFRGIDHAPRGSDEVRRPSENHQTKQQARHAHASWTASMQVGAMLAAPFPRPSLLPSVIRHLRYENMFIPFPLPNFTPRRSGWRLYKPSQIPQLPRP